MIQDLLFYKKGCIRDYLEQRKSALENEVKSMESDYVLNVSEEDLCRYLISEYSLEVPILHENKKYLYNKSEVDIGISVTIAIPFEGDGNLFEYQPSAVTLYYPRGEIRDQEVHLIRVIGGHNAEEARQMYMGDIRIIEEHLNSIKHCINNFNRELETFVRQVVSQRKKKLLYDLGLISDLGIPIRRRDDIPRTYAVPNIRRTPKIERPEVKREAFKPEPTLHMEEYENILSIIQNMVMVMERSPRAFVDMKEEDLRQHFLVQLNGHYEGQATGETFNYEGKTDILIRVENKNVFIAECKFWGGEKKLLKAIDQLLEYTSWRDTKTALLLFNRKKDFSAVLGKIPVVIKSHPCYKREIEVREETIFRYLFHQSSDVNRELILTIMAFNVPK